MQGRTPVSLHFGLLLTKAKPETLANTSAQIQRFKNHSHINSIIHDYYTHHTQCRLNGDSLLVYEDYALLLHSHMFGALCRLSTELPASKLLRCNRCLSHLL